MEVGDFGESECFTRGTGGALSMQPGYFQLCHADRWHYNRFHGHDDF